MYQEAFKIRISDFAYNILDYDAQSFGFIRNGEESNLNGLINKLMSEEAKRKQKFAIKDYYKKKKRENKAEKRNEFQNIINLKI